MGVQAGPSDQLKGGGAGDGLAEEVMFELRFEGPRWGTACPEAIEKAFSQRSPWENWEEFQRVRALR